MGEVAQRLNVLPLSPVSIVVAGTNGKGSVVATLESVYRNAGYSVGCYTSPHLLRYNERVRINGSDISDETLCDAFSRVENARGDLQLTYFEFGTLATAVIFASYSLDVVILEVGLGGRLDAVNIFDADAAIVTNIDLDHMEWLGSDREQIGYEKAGVFRSGKPAICGDPNPPESVIAAARESGAELYIQDKDFSLQCVADSCEFRAHNLIWANLPVVSLAGKHQRLNVATSLMVVAVLQKQLPVSEAQAASAIASVNIPGRFQRLRVAPEIIVDVAHNPQAIVALSELCIARPAKGRTLAVVGMMQDKAIRKCLATMAPLIHQWYLASLPPPRGASSGNLEESLHAVDPAAVYQRFDEVELALQSALSDALPEDRILCFGSFVTVGAIMRRQS